MELYLSFDRLHSQIRQTWRYKVTVACTYTMLQMHVSSLGGTNTQTIMVRTCVPWNVITVFQIIFQNGGDNLCKLVACRLHQMLTAAISEAATAKATALTRLACLFPDKQQEKFQHHLKRHLCLGFARVGSLQQIQCQNPCVEQKDWRE